MLLYIRAQRLISGWPVHVRVSPVKAHPMRYAKIDKNLFINHRKNLFQHLKPHSLAILHASDIMPLSGDGIMPFYQNSDLFYLSGIDQEESILVLYVGATPQESEAKLFLKETNAHIKIWEGEKYTQEEAHAVSGISSIHWLSAFPTALHTLMGRVEHVYLNTNEHPRAVVEVQTRDARFLTSCQKKYPLHRYERLAPLMHHLRAVKSEEEIALIREACAITERGFRRILSMVKPGVMEYAIEAELIHEFITHRSRGFAYGPIIAAGANSCVLHYEKNDQCCQAGDTVLLDVGAEYTNYKSDMTRVIPVNGRFTKRQKEVYNAVLRVMKQAKQLLVPGSDLPTYHQQVGQVLEQELLGLGLIDRKDIQGQSPDHPAYKKYSMHGISHYLGLDTHDVGDMHRKLEAGMVLTVEPGIYIPEEKLGVRLENDVVIRKDGIEDLMAAIPLEAEEIETLMQER